MNLLPVVIFIVLFIAFISELRVATNFVCRQVLFHIF